MPVFSSSTPATLTELILNIEALSGVLGNRGTRAIVSGEQGNNGLKIRGTQA